MIREIMMRRKSAIVILCLTFIASVCKEGLSKDEFTISSKEIIERLTRLEEGQKALNERLDDVNRRIDDLRSELKGDINDLRSMMLTGFGILFAGMFALIGFVIWDRRTAISPVVRKARELEERADVTIRALREYARREPKMEEVLRTLRLL